MPLRLSLYSVALLLLALLALLALLGLLGLLALPLATMHRSPVIVSPEVKVAATPEESTVNEAMVELYWYCTLSCSSN